MKNKIYKIIYLSGLLIDNQANVDSEMNNTIIPEENTIIPKEENIIPETVINQKVNIDMDLFVNSKLVFVGCYAIVCVVVIIFIIVYERNNLFKNIYSNYMNKDNNRIKNIDILALLVQLILIPILSYIIVICMYTSKYINKYIQQYALIKSWGLYMFIMFIYLISVSKGWTTFTQIKDFKEISRIFLILDKNENNGIPFIMFMRSILCTLIFHNIMLITSYSMLKGYYHLRPIKYKEKRDYINTLNNNITPINVLDNNVDNPANVLDNNI